MRKFAVLGASALVLALGVAQASAVPPIGQTWGDYVARTSAQPAQSAIADFGDQTSNKPSAVPSTGQTWAEYVARTSAKSAQASTVDFRNFRAQAADEASTVPSTGQTWANYVARTSAH